MDVALQRAHASGEAPNSGAAGSKTTPTFDPSTLPPPIIERTPIAVEEPCSRRGYWNNLLFTASFVRLPRNLIIFVIVWFMLCVARIVLPWAPLIGPVGTWIILSWYCAFRFSVIMETSTGKDELPDFDLTDGVWDGMVLPFFKWIGSWLIIFAPAFVFAIVALQTMVAASGGFIALLSGGLTSMMQGAIAAEAIVFVLLLLAGLVIWPILILCVALGGFASVARVDLMVVTVFKTFPMYLLTVAVVFGTAFLVPTVEAISAGIPGQIVSIGVALYVEIIAMRVIGLYYFHFKHRFAWSWE